MIRLPGTRYNETWEHVHRIHVVLIHCSMYITQLFTFDSGSFFRLFVSARLSNVVSREGELTGNWWTFTIIDVEVFTILKFQNWYNWKVIPLSRTEKKKKSRFPAVVNNKIPFARAHQFVNNWIIMYTVYSVLYIQRTSVYSYWNAIRLNDFVLGVILNKTKWEKKIADSVVWLLSSN